MPKKKEEVLNYKNLITELNNKGPANLYLLWGEEDYLRETFLNKLKDVCLCKGLDDFSYKKFNGTDINFLELENAINSMPFMTERTLVEVRGLDLNKLKENQNEILLKVIKDIPDYCTLVFVQEINFEPDGRLKIIKEINKLGNSIHFNNQSSDSIVKWLSKRFSSYGKKIDADTARYLIFYCGSLMNQLIPEIDKIAAYSKNEYITKEDINAVANKITEAVIFDLTDYISDRNTQKASETLSALINNKDNNLIALLALISNQMRTLYVGKIANEFHLGRKYVESTLSSHSSFYIDKVLSSSKKFTLKQLKNYIELCCKADYEMKSTSLNDKDILVDLVFAISVGD